MAIRYLLDTNTVRSIIKGSIPAVRERLVRVPMAEVSLSAVAEAELHYAVARRTDAARLAAIVEEFLLRLTILPWDSRAAREYGRLRATLGRQGRPMGNLDMMIAAQALASGLILVTDDQAFARVKKLKIEDWTKA